MDFKIKADLSECNLGKELLKWRAFDYGGSDKDLRISDSWPRTPIGTILFEMRVCDAMTYARVSVRHAECAMPAAAVHSSENSASRGSGFPLPRLPLRRHSVCSGEPGFTARPDLSVADVV